MNPNVTISPQTQGWGVAGNASMALPSTIVPGATNLADSFSGAMITLQPNGAIPLFYMLESMESETALSTMHQYETMRGVYPTSSVTARVPIATAGDITDIPVDNVNGFLPNTMLTNWRTNEYMFVVAINGTASIKVQRGMSGAVPAAMLAGDGLVFAGSAFEQGSIRPMARHHTHDTAHNLTQIIRTSWGVTGTARSVMAKRGDKAVANSKKQGGMWHAQEIERALLMSQLGQGSMNGMPFQTMQGLRQTILADAPANVIQAGATTTYDQLNAMVEPIFQTQVEGAMSYDRIALVDNIGKRVMNQIGRNFGPVQMQRSETTFGSRFTKFETDTGTITFLESALMNMTPELAGTMMLFDLNVLKIAYLGEGDEQRKTQHQGYNLTDGGKLTEVANDSGVDAVGGTFTTELTLTNRNPESCMMIHGLTKGIAG